MISEHLTQWLGLPVDLFDEERAEEGVQDYGRKIYRLSLGWDSENDFPTLFSRFIQGANVAETQGIIIGQFHGDDPETSSEEVVQLLVSARERLPKLRGIFLGEMISEENEISWINQTDVSPLLSAYPNLQELRIRGSQGLSLGGRLVHSNLKTLVIESGGLPPEMIQEVAASQLPALEHLELWLGTSSYGGDATVDDVEPFLKGDIFPNLKRLGLRDSEIVDQIAEAFLGAPVLSKINALDLSLGTLSDTGGAALLKNSALAKLNVLDLHYHFLSKKMMAELRRAFPNVNLNEEQGEQDEGDRYVSVSE